MLTIAREDRWEIQALQVAHASPGQLEEHGMLATVRIAKGWNKRADWFLEMRDSDQCEKTRGESGQLQAKHIHFESNCTCVTELCLKFKIIFHIQYHGAERSEPDLVI